MRPLATQKPCFVYRSQVEGVSNDCNPVVNNALNKRLRQTDFTTSIIVLVSR